MNGFGPALCAGSAGVFRVTLIRADEEVALTLRHGRKFVVARGAVKPPTARLVTCSEQSESLKIDPMLTPLLAQEWNYEAAAHLLNRAAFGGTPDAISAFQEKGFETAVDSLLQPPVAPLNVEGRPWNTPIDLAAKRQALRSLKGIPAEQKAKAREMRH